MSEPEIIKGDKKYWIIGTVVAFLGVGVVRTDVWLWKGTTIFKPLYAVGVAIAILGLALITKGIDKKKESFRSCPRCLSMNPSSAETCRKCGETLPPLKKGRS